MISAWEATGLRLADFNQPPVLSRVGSEGERRDDVMAHASSEQASSTGIGFTFHTCWA